MLIKASLRRGFWDEVSEVIFWIKHIPDYICFLWYVTFKWGKEVKK